MGGGPVSDADSGLLGDQCALRGSGHCPSPKVGSACIEVVAQRDGAEVTIAMVDAHGSSATSLVRVLWKPGSWPVAGHFPLVKTRASPGRLLG